VSAPTRSELDLETRDTVLRVTFTRPDVLNALTPTMLAEATRAIGEAGHDDGVRAVLLTARGRAFSSGADLGGSDDTERKTAVLDEANALVAAIVACPKPVVAGVNGLAAGVGATIALSCDLVVARASSYVLLAFANIGLMPDGGATAILPAAIGRVRASRMALLAERIPAAQAFEWGLISHVVDDDAYEQQLEDLLARLAGGPTLAYARTKAALGASTLALLEQAQRLERDGQIELFDSSDVTEGVAAFRERRRPNFTGH
jgi:enoyl-CoA hydratase/carnithine racemase